MRVHRNMTPNEVLTLTQNEEKDHQSCKYGSGYLTEEDLTNVAHHLRLTETELKERYLEEAEKFGTKAHKPKLIREGKPYGTCVFLKGGKCGIEEAKPFHCRISNKGDISEDVQQWFDLNFFVNPKDRNSIREYAQVLKVRDPIDGGELEELVPDKQKLKEILEEHEN